MRCGLVDLRTNHFSLKFNDLHQGWFISSSKSQMKLVSWFIRSFVYSARLYIKLNHWYINLSVCNQIKKLFSMHLTFFPTDFFLKFESNKTPRKKTNFICSMPFSSHFASPPPSPISLRFIYLYRKGLPSSKFSRPLPLSFSISLFCLPTNKLFQCNIY